VDLSVPVPPQRGGFGLSGWSARLACAGASAGRPLAFFQYESYLGAMIYLVASGLPFSCPIRF